MSKDESDPKGKSQHDSGAKLDCGKIRAGLVVGSFGKALMRVSKVGTDGARKYSDRGYLEVEDGVGRYTDALYRHLLAIETEELDLDSGLPHIDHVAWNALAVIELTERRKEESKIATPPNPHIRYKIGDDISLPVYPSERKRTPKGPHGFQVGKRPRDCMITEYLGLTVAEACDFALPKLNGGSFRERDVSRAIFNYHTKGINSVRCHAAVASAMHKLRDGGYLKIAGYGLYEVAKEK
jgi:hypothetical protein